MQQLEILDKHLRTTRPDFYAQLNDPLTDEEIQALEEQYKVTLPDDLKALYKWKNGQKDDCYEALVNNSMFISLEVALEIAEECTSMIGLDFEIENWWNQHWIPMFNNGSNDYLCYDMGGTFTGITGQILEFWHADNDRNVIAPTLESFIAVVNRYYETTNPAEFDEFFTLKENIDGFPKKFIVE